MNQRVSSWLWYFGILITLIGLLFSFFLIGIGAAILLLAWFAEKDFQQKFNQIKKQPSILSVPLIFVIFFISILWSENKKFALDQTFINLPLLFLPVVVATSKTIDEKYAHNIFKIFVLLSVLKALQGFFLIIIDHEKQREALAGNLSHIVISTTLTWSILLAFYYLLKAQTKYKIFLAFSIISIASYIYILKSYTGYIILSALIIFNALYFFVREKHLTPKIIFATILLVVIGYMIYLIIDEKKYFFPINKNNFKNLPTHTINGNPYWTDTTNLQKENGNFVYSLICEKELREHWNRISKIDYDTGYTDTCFFLKEVLFRYLTSLNLPKDSFGISQLTKEDINNIENSCTNKRIKESSKLREMVYLFYWQIYEYITTKDASNKSLAQRLEYMKVSLLIIKDHPLLGTGLGDFVDVYKHYLDKTTKLPEHQKKYVHNQYILAIATVGIPLGILILLLTFVPFFATKSYKNYLSLNFIFILTLYMLSDITFGRSQTAVLLGLFYTLLTYKLNNYDKPTTN